MPDARRHPAGTTPFPNFLLDEALPRLKGSEWKLLCVIVRQTCGWVDPSGGRKTSDLLTHRQLMQRSGLASASVSRAVETLARDGLIEVRDAAGVPLRSAAERRRCAGPLRFSLASKGARGSAASQRGGGNPARPDRRRPTHLDEALAVFGDDAAGTRDAGDGTPPQKVRTTKEREYKNTFVVLKNEDEPGTALPGTAAAPLEGLSPQATQALRLYRARFRELRAGEKVPPTHREALEELQALVGRHGLEEVARLLDRFFESRHGFIARRGYSLDAFTASANVLRYALAAPKPAA